MININHEFGNNYFMINSQILILKPMQIHVGPQPYI